MNKSGVGAVVGFVGARFLLCNLSFAVVYMWRFMVLVDQSDSKPSRWRCCRHRTL